MTREEIVFLKSLTNKIEEDLSDCDISTVLKLAQHHSVLPLCYENLSMSRGFEPSKYTKIQQKVFSAVLSQTKRTSQFKKIYQELIDNDIKPIVLKGIILRQLYGDLCDHRPSGDEDVLVRSEDFFKVRDILINNGFISNNEMITEKMLANIQEITFKNPDSGLSIEIHLNLIGNENKTRQKMNRYFKNVFEKSVLLNIDGQNFYTLDYTSNYIYLFFHFFKHLSLCGVGVRQLLDMFRFAEKYHEFIDWKEVKNAIAALSAEKLYADVVEIGNKYMGFSMNNLFRTVSPERLLKDMLNTGVFGNATAENAGTRPMMMAAVDGAGKMRKIRTIFPSIGTLREYYTILFDHPYLLPFVWIWRIIRYIFRVVTGKKKSLSKSEKIADERIRLLKDYNII